MLKVFQDSQTTSVRQHSRDLSLHSSPITFYYAAVSPSPPAVTPHRLVNITSHKSVNRDQYNVTQSSVFIHPARRSRYRLHAVPSVVPPCVETVNTPRLPATGREYTDLLPGWDRVCPCSLRARSVQAPASSVTSVLTFLLPDGRGLQTALPAISVASRKQLPAFFLLPGAPKTKIKHVFSWQGRTATDTAGRHAGFYTALTE